MEAVTPPMSAPSALDRDKETKTPLCGMGLRLIFKSGSM